MSEDLFEASSMIFGERVTTAIAMLRNDSHMDRLYYSHSDLNDWCQKRIKEVASNNYSELLMTSYISYIFYYRYLINILKYSENIRNRMCI